MNYTANIMHRQLWEHPMITARYAYTSDKMYKYIQIHMEYTHTQWKYSGNRMNIYAHNEKNTV